MATVPGDKRTALEVAALNKANIQGKKFLVTGAYSGIGVETTKALLAMGAKKIVLAGRSQKLQDEFVAELAKTYDADRVDGGGLLDLSDLASVKEFAEYVKKNYDSIDVLILNAGIMNTPQGVTKQGIEQQMGVNVVGHFLLAKSLVNITKRQVWLSSSAHTRNGGPRINLGYLKNFSMESEYDGFTAYQQSKLGDILLAKEFSKRYSSIEAAAVHPGVIKTNLGRHFSFFQMAMFFLFHAIPGMIKGTFKFKSIEQGAATNVHVASISDIVNGAYYADCDIAEEYESAKNEEDAKALFEYCDEITKDFQ